MNKKIQIWFRRDQAECAMQALAYVAARFEDHGGKMTQQPAVTLACNLAIERAEEARTIIANALDAQSPQPPASLSAGGSNET
jgi:hypothetical protein